MHLASRRLSVHIQGKVLLGMRCSRRSQSSFLLAPAIEMLIVCLITKKGLQNGHAQEMSSWLFGFCSPIHPFDFSLPTCKVLGHPLIRRRLQQYRLLWGGATVARVNLWLVWLVRLLMMQHCDTMWIPLSLDPIGLFNKQAAFHWTAFPPDISLTDWCIREVRGTGSSDLETANVPFKGGDL